MGISTNEDLVNVLSLYGLTLVKKHLSESNCLVAFVTGEDVTCDRLTEVKPKIEAVLPLGMTLMLVEGEG